jgi:hypothetical protein
LIKYGVVAAKSLILNPTKLETNELQRHYWRGFIDGDGSICQIRKKIKGSTGYKFVWNISLNGTLSVVTAFRDFILSNLEVCNGSIDPHYNIWKARWAGDKACKLITNFLYKNCDQSIVLDRKKELSKQLRMQPRYHKGNPKPIFYE